MTEPNAEEIDQGQLILQKLEKEHGKLTRAQRIDLLWANSNRGWTHKFCRRIIKSLG